MAKNSALLTKASKGRGSGPSLSRLLTKAHKGSGSKGSLSSLLTGTSNAHGRGTLPPGLKAPLRSKNR